MTPQTAGNQFLSVTFSIIVFNCSCENSLDHLLTVKLSYTF